MLTTTKYLTLRQRCTACQAPEVASAHAVQRLQVPTAGSRQQVSLGAIQLGLIQSSQVPSAHAQAPRGAPAQPPLPIQAGELGLVQKLVGAMVGGELRGAGATHVAQVAAAAAVAQLGLVDVLASCQAVAAGALCQVAYTQSACSTVGLSSGDKGQDLRLQLLAQRDTSCRL